MNVIQQIRADRRKKVLKEIGGAVFTVLGMIVAIGGMWAFSWASCAAVNACAIANGL